MSEEDFHRSVADAQEWMKAVHERLHANDNTQGPRAALEARLQETEVCRSGRRYAVAWPLGAVWPLPLVFHLLREKSRLDAHFAHSDVLFRSPGDFA